MAPAVVAVVAQVVAQVLADRLAAAVRLVRRQVAVAARRAPLQPEPEVAALLLVQGWVASQSLRSH